MVTAIKTVVTVVLKMKKELFLTTPFSFINFPPPSK